MKLMLNLAALIAGTSAALAAITPPKAPERAAALEVPAQPSTRLYAAGELPPTLSAADREAVARLAFEELPPAYYLRPTTVPVLVVDIGDEVTLRWRCKWPPRKQGEGALAGCSFPMASGCVVYLGPESDRAAFGLPRDAVLAHETGHCNGWPADHPRTAPAIAKAPAPLVIAQNEPVEEAAEEPAPPPPPHRPRRPHYGPPPYYPPPLAPWPWHPCPIIGTITLGFLCI